MKIRNELKERYKNQIRAKYSMTNLLVKILVLLMLIAMIGFFGNKKESKFRNIFKVFSKKNKVQMIK